MKRISTILGLLAVSSVVPSMAQAERFDARRDCNGSNFTTCASVQVGMVGRELSFRRGNHPGNFGMNDHRVRIGDWREGLPILIGTGDDLAPCPTAGGALRHPGDCPPDTTVTPEPVSMVLLATGIVGILGASRSRRRNGALV